MSQLSTLAIYGGTFDPVHRAHMTLAAQCLSSFQFDRLHLMPCAIPDYKHTPVASAHRVAMLEIAVRQWPAMVVDRRELLREGVTYTADTIREIRREFGAELRIFFMLGSDSWHSFCTWEDWEYILAQVNIILVERPGYPLVSAALPVAMQDLYAVHRVRDKDAFVRARSAAIYVMQVPLLDISSTQIRQRLCASQDTSDSLCSEVREYIDYHQLYRAARA